MWKNGVMEGKGIYYSSNGDRILGDYLNNRRTGKHIILHSNIEITSKYY